MSLTGLLKNPDSNVSRFFTEYFPDRERFAKEWQQRIAGASTISPRGALWKYPWSLAGQAVDYRLRRCFGFYRAEDTVAARGAIASYALGNSYLSLWRELVPYWEDAKTDRFLVRMCLAFAKFETIFRSGKVDIRMPRTVNELLESFPNNVVEDVQALADRFMEVSQDYLSKKAILNPTFDGSQDVGGADADIIIGRTLIDFKTTIHPENLGESFWPYQLLGYGLLDYSNRYKMKEAGIYLVRQGLWVIFTWEELALLLGAGPGVKMGEWREAFGEAIWAD